MIVVDPIFEQHYRKKFDIHIQNSFNQGRSQGVMDILNVIQHFNENEMPVTPKTVLMFLQQMEQQAQTVQNAPAPENKCGEIPHPSGEAQVCTIEPPPEEPPKQRPKLEIVK